MLSYERKMKKYVVDLIKLCFKIYIFLKFHNVTRQIKNNAFNSHGFTLIFVLNFSNLKR